MTSKAFGLIAMLTSVPLILTVIIWVVTDPITFLDRITVIRFAGMITITVYIAVIMLSTLQTVIEVTQKDEQGE